MLSLTSVIIKNSKRQELTNTNKFLTIFAFFIVAGFLSLVMVGVSITATLRLKEINQSYAFVNMLFLMNFVILFSESIFHSLNILYFSKDLNTFLRMPIKSKDLVGAKLKDMILSQYEMEILMLAIPTITYGIISKVSALFYVYLFVILLILPIIPIVISTLIIAIIMRFTNFIKNKSKVMYITIILSVLLLGIVLGGFGDTKQDFTVSTFEKIILQADGLANEISNRFILIKPIMNTLLNYNNNAGLKNLLIYFLETIIVYEIGVSIISRIYLKGAIGTVINGQKFRKKLDKLTQIDLKKRNKEKTYFEKELKITLRSPIFLIQCILMPLLYPVITSIVIFAILRFAQKVNVDVMRDILQKVKNGLGYSAFLAVAQGFFMLNFSSIIAVSKEGRSSILLKTFPISLEKQFKLKTRIGIIINSLSIIIITTTYYYLFKNFILALLMFISLELLNVFGEKWKLLVDLKNPQIKWSAEYTMMKQNTNVMYELFYTILVVIFLAFIGLIFKTVENTSICILCILILLNVMMDSYIYKNIRKIFKNLF